MQSERPLVPQGTGGELIEQTGWSKLINNTYRARELGVLGAAVLIFVVLSLSSDVFMSVSNLLNVARQMSLLGIIAVGMTYLIIAGELDLSVGSLYGVSGVILGLLIKEYGFNPWIAFLFTIAVGGCIGLFNGLITTKVGIPAFVVTLGMLSALRGFSLILSGGWPVSGFAPSSFFSATGGYINDIVPVQVVWTLVIMIIGGWVLMKTKFGYHVYATGGNTRAARLSGINTDRVKLTCFILTGCLTATAASMYVGFFKSAQPMAGAGLELEVIAAVIIGGTNLFGGLGSVLGTFLGAAIMGMIRNGLILMGVAAYWQEVTIGFIIIAAVILDVWLRRRRAA